VGERRTGEAGGEGGQRFHSPVQIPGDPERLKKLWILKHIRPISYASMLMTFITGAYAEHYNFD